MLLRNVYFPAFLYNALPYAYVASGLATIAWLGEGPGLFSGGALISAGVSVWTLRWRYRRARRRRRARSGSAFRPHDRLARRLDELAWRAEYACGHPVIDRQHRRLLTAGTELVHAVLRNEPRADVEWMLNDIVDHLNEHFCTEEALLAKTRHPLSEEHKAVHRALLAKAGALQQRFAAGKIGAGDVAGFVAVDLVKGHIAGDDRRLVPAAAEATAPSRSPEFQPSA